MPSDHEPSLRTDLGARLGRPADGTLARAAAGLGAAVPRDRAAAHAGRHASLSRVGPGAAAPAARRRSTAGHRIGAIAGLADAELAALGSVKPAPQGDPCADILAALAAFDAAEAQRLLALQLSALGPVRFAHEIALPLAREIGARWSDRRIGVACEHLGTALLRSLLGSALQPGAHALRGARIVFATLAGERHELGLLMAAHAALGAGANPLYLGPDVPAEELLHACAQSGAAALALSLVNPASAEEGRLLAALRADLPASVSLWIGGAGAAPLVTPAGVERIASLEQLEQRVALLERAAHG